MLNRDLLLGLENELLRVLNLAKNSLEYDKMQNDYVPNRQEGQELHNQEPNAYRSLWMDW